MTNSKDVPLAPQEVAQLLQNTTTVLRQLVTALPNHVVVLHPGSGKWCIKEVIGHLTEEDKRDFVGRIRMMLDEPEPSLKVSDQEEVARARRDCEKNLHDLLDEFNTVRSSSVAFVMRLRATELDRGGVHPKIGHICIRELLHEWIYHDLNHIRQIDANFQRFLWDHLGNMQRFYPS
jgi:hypothetical protein